MMPRTFMGFRRERGKVIDYDGRQIGTWTRNTWPDWWPRMNRFLSGGWTVVSVLFWVAIGINIWDWFH